MKDFQLNYTTPEQSKWLLELGVPADSADMKYYELHSITDKDVPYFLPPRLPYSKSSMKGYHLPCWSVGRLIEIYHICDKPGCSFTFNVCFPNLVSEMIHEISLAKERGWIDFSKLEDFMKRSNGNNSVL